jgi:hypothetical protein
VPPQRRDREVERQVGPDVTTGGGVQAEQIGRRDAPPATLVGDGRIRVAIRDHHGPATERRKDGLVQQLHAFGGEEQRLGPGFERRATLVLEHEAVQDLTEGSLVRTDGDHVVALLAQGTGKGGDLGALASTVKPFK